VTDTKEQEALRTNGLTVSQAVAVGVNSTSPAFSLASILAPMAVLVGYATPIVLVVSFIPMALTSLAFMYLNRRDPDCGTTFSWVSRAIGPSSGFLAGWAIAASGTLVIGSLAETAIRYGFLTIGLHGLAENRLLVVLLSALLIIGMTGLAIAGADSSIKMQTILTFAQVAILLAFGIAAAFLEYRNAAPFLSGEWMNPLSHGISNLTSAMLLGVFAFWGWEAATNLSEECRRPSDAGKAGVVATIVLLTTYVLVGIFGVSYLGESGFKTPTGSGLALVDMSHAALGPFAFLILLAVALSAFASTQTTLIPGSRAVLSMARRGALPARFGLMHPRFKSPWVSLALLGGLAATWYLAVSSVSENAMLDGLAAIGIIVAFYYSITGIACVVYFRKHVVASMKGFLLVGVGPILGSVGLAVMLVLSIRSVSDPAKSASGQPWLGLAPPLLIVLVALVSGLVVIAWRRVNVTNYFKAPREVASAAQSPFPIGRERNIPEGGVLIDCNDAPEHVIDRLEAFAGNLQDASAISMVFGIQPSGVSGEELEEARAALIDEGGTVFRSVERVLRSRGVRKVHRLFEEADSSDSVEIATELVKPASTI
jgi:amino acid transporter